MPIADEHPRTPEVLTFLAEHTSSEQRIGLRPDTPAYRKLLRNVVAQRIAGMRAHGIGLVELEQRMTVRIRFPTHVAPCPESAAGSADR
jgi:hypothetical protein